MLLRVGCDFPMVNVIAGLILFKTFTYVYITLYLYIIYMHIYDIYIYVIYMYAYSETSLNMLRNPCISSSLGNALRTVSVLLHPVYHQKYFRFTQ